MPLQIRNERARNLARKLAAKRKVTMTDAVVMALEAELRRAEEPLARQIARIADELAQHAGPNRRRMTKAQIDAMWGHR
ncbi:MAG: type II toxin-antitoxin system VapB family antitoxin [Hyphomicrobiales bacterium]|nr:type II toxin-antitoxin system VapB family antitoxin [Hyphomicrobiales bacterium]MBV9752698.1 type II toxin-antitoxin system VapB family antitoxin [Hyphomicrobiales bacterium]